MFHKNGGAPVPHSNSCIKIANSWQFILFFENPNVEDDRTAVGLSEV